ncbi:uncharacterized protein Z519_00230 [Cladophialophora bantiana CBS 173.52]|uniref:Condensin complex subunit 2 n=1 Tax=Cladophialophora bantiana (strain ATCC 10958 / CBS 173.52 / CDC B-1940 / NIH 8579) TaxID=1442370 RepID=A0A0D2IPA2_CLAB1|nr:uncharacterized protein Z519_00230 [Cladophialophora bantiana CBS 173.52]KIW98569.1 hypothetical protein Z519_00230 [Cladophialophora bantiana CBS 173.52]
MATPTADSLEALQSDMQYFPSSRKFWFASNTNLLCCFNRIPLNDDKGEKVARLHSRHALQEIHMNEIRAAASPVRKLHQRRRESNYSNMSDSPRTPRSQDHGAQVRRRGGPSNQQRNNNDHPRNSFGRVAEDSGVTPMKRVPILANFEEWMKMATDNKINAANSWNFALIDYFHDMSLLKEGDGVNFQKASCTLDGCVKIYTSRVDSVATETGRLLSGLADGGASEGSKKRSKGDGNEEEDEDEEGEDGEDGEDGEGGGKRKSKKKPMRSHEATLAPGFASFQGKKLELEFAVDPLFKKASADFDEGGAKGLLLNHLSIDSDGRIVFDSSDDAGDAALGGEKDNGQQEKEDEVESTGKEPHAPDSAAPDEEPVADDQDGEIDLASLASKFFPDMSVLDSQDICPSMKSFTLGDPSGDLNLPFLKVPEDWKEHKRSQTPAPPPATNFPLGLADQTGIFLDGSNAMGFDDDDDGDGLLGGFDVADNVGFGEGGEAWAKDAALEAQARVARAEDVDDNLLGDAADGYALALQHKYQEDAEHESIMAYFDKAFNSRAKGKTAFLTLENWRMQKIQKAQQQETSGTNAPPTRQKKEKEPYEIDFLGPMSDSLKELLEQPPVLNSQISLPKSQWRTKGRNLLDKDDEVVDPRKLMRLWTKPKCRVGRIRRREGGVGMGIIDEGFGARNRVGTANTSGEVASDELDDEGRKGDYDANFFADDDQRLPFDGPLPIDDDDDDDGIVDGGGDDGGQAFMDAREMLSPQPESQRDQHQNLLNGEARADIDQAESQQSQQNLEAQQSQPDLLPGSFGSQLVTQAGRRIRPEYVNYARTAKKVDVRRLKENLWKGMEGRLQLINVFDRPSTATTAEQRPREDGDGDVDMMDIDDDQPQQEEVPPKAEEPPTPAQDDPNSPRDPDDSGTLNFTDLIQDLRSFYPEPQMKDISTSYCFICLLHLANEKGLVLQGERDGENAMQEIKVTRDPAVGEGYEGE